MANHVVGFMKTMMTMTNSLYPPFFSSTKVRCVEADLLQLVWEIRVQIATDIVKVSVV